MRKGAGVRSLAGLFLLTVALTLFGVLTRGVETLSLFWPVNAILLGLLLRRPRLTRPAGWAVLYVGMVLTDLAMGSSWQSSLWLNFCNMGLIGSGWLILRREKPARLRLRQHEGLLSLFAASGMGAAVAATLACLPADDPHELWLSWFCEQFSTTLLLLPVMLTAPLRLKRGWSRPRLPEPRQVAPLAGLLLALLAMVVIGGPGGIVFPVLPMLWCAMRFRLFTVAVLGLFIAMLEVVLVASYPAYFGVSAGATGIDTLNSARLGIAVLALGPLMVASASTVSRRLLLRLLYRSDRDFLTGMLNRSAFARRTEGLLERRRQQEVQHVAVLMLDLDHFKSINDHHGHATGDRVLRRVAELLRQQLRQEDLLCRLGGEEFTALLPSISIEEAAHIAERLRGQIEQLPLTTEHGEPLRVTISIGVGQLGDSADELALEHALARADEALYRAKAQGRNRVALAG
jgi:diguanylate cyclase (GGDEF)-like protein